MKTPEEIKMGLEYASTTNIARKVMLAKAGRVPYAYTEELAADALAYIQQLEAELAKYTKPIFPLTFIEAMEDDYYLEIKGDEYIDMALNELAFDGDEGFIVFNTHDEDGVKLMRKDYGKTWRCWDSIPTDEERKAAKWDE